MATIQNFEDLKVWQKARSLCQEISLIISQGNFSKDFGLKDQINRSSGSCLSPLNNWTKMEIHFRTLNLRYHEQTTQKMERI